MRHNLISTFTWIVCTLTSSLMQPTHALRGTSLTWDGREQQTVDSHNNNLVNTWSKNNLRSIIWSNRNELRKYSRGQSAFQGLTKEQALAFDLNLAREKSNSKWEFVKLLHFLTNKNGTSLTGNCLTKIGSLNQNKNGEHYKTSHKHGKNHKSFLLKKISPIYSQSHLKLKHVLSLQLEKQSLHKNSNTRRRRSTPTFVHKLIRTPFHNSTEESSHKGNILSDLKLNTSSFGGPNSKEDDINSSLMSYEKVEDLALADLNGTDIQINVNSTNNESLPSPEELVSGPRYRTPTKSYITYVKGESKRKRIPSRVHHLPKIQRRCQRFTASMCIKAEDYPLDSIMGSIRRHKNAMSALLAEYYDRTAELEEQEQYEEYHFKNKRREDDNIVTPGGMCASIVRYARPQKARSASGEWKYIVNAGRHTQTLRLEKCSTPQESCSYLSHNYRSRCIQVYNYHRLLSWDKVRGLHVDIFKVPTCCSCQIDGYRETFPPLGSLKYNEYKDYTPVPNNNPYANMNDEIDYEDEDDADSPIVYHVDSTLRKTNQDHYDQSEVLLESSNIKNRVKPPTYNPTIGSYLSPPSGNYEPNLKVVGPTYYSSANGRSRKPYKTYVPHESRADLEISGTEHTDKEVKNVLVNENSRIYQKRTRLYTDSSNLPYEISTAATQTKTSPSYIPTTELTPVHLGTSGIPNPREIGSNKRINYNYHPIIDFFERNQKSAKGQTYGLSSKRPENSIPITSEVIISRDQSIGYGIRGHENTWHPLVATG